MKLVFDIEANGLLPTVSKFHCAGAIDYNTGKEYWFRPEEFGKFLNFLMEADTVIAHNAFGYDIPALYKLAGIYGMKFEIDPAKVQCTKVMSQVLNYRRFGFGHSLKKWGEFFQDNKGDYDGGWEEFNEEMFEYMKQDVRLGTKVYNHLIGETRGALKQMGSKKILRALRSEMEMDRIMAEQCQNGWQFNLKGAKELLSTIEGRMTEMEEFINPQLPARTKKVDDAPKAPKYTKAGKLVAHLHKWFQFDNVITVTNSPLWGEFSRIEFIAGDIGNTDTVKRLLFSLGWKPDDWNWKKINGQFVKVSPKLTESSMAGLGDVGKALSEYYTLRSRHSILKGWFEHVDSNSRLHGDVFNVGTPTFRQTHKIIANLPSGKATLGPEMRSLFVAKQGYKLVSADSAGCQLRLLAHFMKDDNFTREVLEGDIHQKNADILGCSRPTAKPFIFAFLYGAGGKKLGSILGCSEKEGNKKKKLYLDSMPSLKNLIKKVQNIVEHQGYIPGLDDRPIHTESAHKALNYLIQGAEAVVMKETVIMIDKKLKEANIDFRHLLFYHDEHTVEVPEQQAEEARDIIMKCFEEAPKPLGVDIMTCGDCKIGDDYYDVH
jgi:DNA polymerase-1